MPIVGRRCVKADLAAAQLISVAMDVPLFQSPQEEARYWRLKAEEYKKIGEDARLDLEEYQESSREVEAELEIQLKQAQNQVRDLRNAQHRLLMDHNSLKEKFETLSREHHTVRSELETQVKELRAKRDETTYRIRQLEQTNDDLERANRATLGSLEDFEARLHQAIERNAFLESELDDKESLAVMVQRLKDETKELKQELQVRQRSIHETPDNEKNVGVVSLPVAVTPLSDTTIRQKTTFDAGYEKSDPTKSPTFDSNKLPTTPTGSPQQQPPPVLKLPLTTTTPVDNAAITPAARHSALNIVGDLLRRVGALENKLSTCRTMVKESNGAHKETTRGKLLTRATSTTGVQSIIRA